MFIKIWGTLSVIYDDICLNRRIRRKIFYNSNDLAFDVFFSVIDSIFNGYRLPDRVLFVKVSFGTCFCKHDPWKDSCVYFPLYRWNLEQIKEW